MAYSFRHIGDSLRQIRLILHHMRLQPPSHAVAAFVTYGCSLPRIRPQSEILLQYNQTRSCVFGVNGCSMPWRDVVLPLQLAVETALLGELATPPLSRHLPLFSCYTPYHATPLITPHSLSRYTSVSCHPPISCYTPSPGELAAYGLGVAELPTPLKLGLQTQPFPNPEMVGFH